MSFKIETEKVLIWDLSSKMMVTRIKVHVGFFGDKGMLFYEAGPLYCETGQDVYFAVKQLKEEIIQELINNSIDSCSDSFNDFLDLYC